MKEIKIIDTQYEELKSIFTQDYLKTIIYLIDGEVELKRISYNIDRFTYLKEITKK